MKRAKTAIKRGEFLEAFKNFGLIRVAADAAGIDRKSHFNWLKLTGSIDMLPSLRKLPPGCLSVPWFSVSWRNKAANDTLAKVGYDGITHEGGQLVGRGHSHQVWIAFEPNQVKSADNRGTFDPNEDRMDYGAEQYRLKPGAGQTSMFDESEHPRDSDGQFATKENKDGGAKREPVVRKTRPAHADVPAGDGGGIKPERLRGLFDEPSGGSEGLIRDGGDGRDGPKDGKVDDSDGYVPTRRRRSERDHSVGNWRYPDREFTAGGLKPKFRANIDAIKTLRTIESEGRNTANAEEQAVLSKFSGWGQFQAAFKPHPPENWRKEQEELKGLIRDREFNEAKESSGANLSYEEAKKALLNSHFTSPQIVDAHWRIAQKLGFDGGRYLEPSVGSGYYLGMMPPELAKKTSVTGIELDRTTAQIPWRPVPVRGSESEHLQYPCEACARRPTSTSRLPSPNERKPAKYICGGMPRHSLTLKRGRMNETAKMQQPVIRSFAPCQKGRGANVCPCETRRPASRRRSNVLMQIALGV